MGRESWTTAVALGAATVLTIGLATPAGAADPPPDEPFTTILDREFDEDGLGGWTTEVKGDLAPWAVDAFAGVGPVAQGPAESGGPCAPDGPGRAGRTSLVSPSFSFSKQQRTPRVRMHHAFRLEDGHDGAALRLSIDGGPFEDVPADAWLAGAPAGDLSDAADGNPLAGSRVWTGRATAHDYARRTFPQGSAFALRAAGARPGQRLRLRLDVGRDRCGGEYEGAWSVEDVSVVSGREPLYLISWIQDVREADHDVLYGDPMEVRSRVGSHAEPYPVPRPRGRVRVDDRRLGDLVAGPLVFDHLHRVRFNTVTLGLGWHRVTTRYSGDRFYAPLRKLRPWWLRVNQGHDEPLVRIRPHQPVSGDFRVTFRTPESRGVAQLIWRGEVIMRRRLRIYAHTGRVGTATFHVTRHIPPGLRRFTFRWTGNDHYRPSQVTYLKTVVAKGRR